MTTDRAVEQSGLDVTEDVVACALDMADAAAEHTLLHFRHAYLDIENKLSSEDGRAFDPVTIADRNAEAALRSVLANRRPYDSVLGEELGRHEGTSGLTWVLDPIDGTRAYVIGAPTWGTLIALCDDTGPILGVLDQPYTGERWIGGLGHAEFRRKEVRRPLQSRQTASLQDAVLTTTFPEVGTDSDGAAFRRVARQVRLTRYGFDCYGYALLASGGVDLVIEAGLETYDICAPLAVVEASGGIVTDWNGNPAHDGGRVLAASNPTIHAAALELLSADV